MHLIHRISREDEATLGDQDVDDDYDDDITSPFGESGFKEKPTPLTDLTFREKLMRAVNSIWWQGVVVLLILLDVILFILQLVSLNGHSQSAKDLARDFESSGPLTSLGTAIIVILLVEVWKQKK